MTEIEQKIRRRMRRIEATVRWSRMNGWRGMVPGAMLLEYATLKGLVA